MAAVDIQHNEFVFTLGGDWTQVTGADPEQFIFESKEKESTIVLSIVQSNIPATRLTEVAEKFAEFRKDEEQRARPGQTITYGDQWLEINPTGDVVDIAYAAYDDTGTIFRFYGFVTQAKILSFWVATSGGDNELSKRVFDEAFRGLQFYVP